MICRTQHLFVTSCSTSFGHSRRQPYEKKYKVGAIKSHRKIFRKFRFAPFLSCFYRLKDRIWGYIYFPETSFHWYWYFQKASLIIFSKPKMNWMKRIFLQIAEVKCSSKGRSKRTDILRSGSLKYAATFMGWQWVGFPTHCWFFNSLLFQVAFIAPIPLSNAETALDRTDRGQTEDRQGRDRGQTKDRQKTDRGQARDRQRTDRTAIGQTGDRQRTDRGQTGQIWDRQNWHLNLTFQVTCVWQLSYDV